ncbi:MAG: PaaI family thioesterase [Crocinitomicaceae bacterium]|jgi:acyl-coenzyme A thioesterase PaaI-like protein|nr:PaaI family thioesterase [Crocinitomicaceae bacterium]
MVKSIPLSKLRRNIWLLGKFKIPILGFANPKLISINEDEVVMKIKLRRRTKNHLNSMYFGALAVGADTAAGIHAYYLGVEKGLNLSLAFKSCKAEFLKRAETDVTFVCKEGRKIAQQMVTSQSTGERQNEDIFVEAFNTQKELVATFVMTLSLKVK